MEGIEEISRKQYGKYFLDLTVKEQIEILVAIDKAQARFNRPVSGLIDRINRKFDKIWDELFGIGKVPNFFSAIRDDVVYGYYSNPVSWKVIGYFGPPQLFGYPDYAEPPLSDNYIDKIRPINNKACQNCHFDQFKKKNHKGQSNCMGCHPIHVPFRE